MSKTLAEAIERVVALEESGPPFEGMAAAVAELGKARGRLDGLEESRALIETRSRAYEHATALARQAGAGHWTATHERILEVAQFLAPVWEELEGEDDPLGPMSSVAELEASEAEAVARADALVDQVAELERYLVQAQDRNKLLTEQIQHRDALLESSKASNSEMDLITFNGQPWAMRAELAVEWRRMRDQISALVGASES